MSLTVRVGACTTVVGISTNSSVFLGADSLVSSDGTSAAGRRCKIDFEGSYAASMAGLLADSATSFDARVHVRKALTMPGDLMHKVRTFELSIREPLQRSLDYGRHHAPQVFAAKYSGKKALQTIFGGIEGGRPIMIVSTFRVAEDGGLILDKTKVLGPGQVYVFGESAAIAKYQDGNPDWIAAEPDAIIRKFLALEIEDEPNLVGAPASILQITSGLSRRIDAGQCASR